MEYSENESGIEKTLYSTLSLLDETTLRRDTQETRVFATKELLLSRTYQSQLGATTKADIPLILRPSRYTLAVYMRWPKNLTSANAHGHFDSARRAIEWQIDCATTSSQGRTCG